MTKEDGPQVRILVVEDEVHLAVGIKLNLELEGYAVDVAATVREARQLLVGQVNYALMLLDVMLPDMNGMDFCASIRQAGNRIPIVMLTALGDASERVRGLDSGADDYLPKPFHLDELLARVKAQLRRSLWNGASSDDGDARFIVGKLTVDFGRREAYRDGVSITLTHLEFELLKYFADHPNRVISRDELLSEVWGIEHALSSRTVDNFILRLRKVVERTPASPEVLCSVRGAGYRFRQT